MNKIKVFFRLFFSFLLQITNLSLLKKNLYNYIAFFSYSAQLPRRYGIVLAILIEKNLHGGEKGLRAKYGSKNAEPGKGEVEGKGREQECGGE